MAARGKQQARPRKVGDDGGCYWQRGHSSRWWMPDRRSSLASLARQAVIISNGLTSAAIAARMPHCLARPCLRCPAKPSCASAASLLCPSLSLHLLPPTPSFPLLVPVLPSLIAILLRLRFLVSPSHSSLLVPSGWVRPGHSSSYSFHPASASSS